jgi:pseudaminic acid synthase
MDCVRIGGIEVGAQKPCFIVAELSANHNQSYQKAVEIIHAAKESGADAVKLQTYTPDTITIRSDRSYFRIDRGPWSGQTLYDLYQKAFTPWDWQPGLKEEAEKIGLILFSTPFDNTAVDFLSEMDVPAFKIASFELVDLPLIETVAKNGKPIILSTGMGSLAEIEEAIVVTRRAGNNQIVLLRCVSAYPADPGDANLKTIPNLSETFGVPAGLSDHTLGHDVALTAVVLGACMVEKHLTLKRDEGGPDAGFSSEPHEFKAMVDAIRLSEKASGSVRYGPSVMESENRAFRRSLFVVKDVKKDDKVTDENVRSIRPGDGLHTRHLKEILGRRFKKDVCKGTPLSCDLIL